MLFPTLDFGVFFLVVFAGAWLSNPWPTARKVFLTAASYFFYGYWDWRFCFLLLGNSLLVYIAGRGIEAARTPAGRRRWMQLGVVVNLIVLGFFKYFDFFVESVNDGLHSLGFTRELPFLEIVLPVGISFYTFQGISYVMDVYRREIPAAHSLLDVLLYKAFFPQLVAGPIVRASTLMPQFERSPSPDRVLAGMGFLMILLGLFKKVVVANYLATDMVDQAFFDPTVYGPADLLLAIYGYAIQIYCDFSGYTDMAIGTAALLGYRFQQNFNQPYRAEGVRDLWRRWHISLSSWLRDYLYIPLGGNRGGPWAMRRNALITMVLGGVWHGAAWHYVFWGFLHGMGLVIESFLPRSRGPRPVWRRALAVFITFHFVCLAYIFFRAESFSLALDYLASFANWDAPVTFATPLLLTLVGLGIASQFTPPDLLARVERGFRWLPALAQGVAVGFLIAAIDSFGPEGVAPFIYFQF